MARSLSFLRRRPRLYPVQNSLVSWFSATGSQRRILVGTITLAVAALAAKLMAMGRDLVVAGRYGAGDELDVFLAAFLLPSFATGVVTNSFAPALLPVFVRIREQQGRVAAGKLLSTAVVVGFGLLALIAAALVLGSGWLVPWLAAGFSGEKISLTQSLLTILAGTIVLTGLSSMLGVALNSSGHFRLVAGASLAVPAVGLVTFYLLEQRLGISALAWGTLGGCLVEVGILVCGVCSQGLAARPGWPGSDAHLRSVAGQYFTLLAGTTLMSIGPLFDQSLAMHLEPGSIAALSYGNKLVVLLSATVVSSFTTAIFPHFSRLVAGAQWRRLQHTLRVCTWVVLPVGGVLTVALILWSEPIARLLFQRGAMTVEQTRLVAQVQACYVLQLPCFILGQIAVRLLNAMRGGRSMLWICALNLLVNVGCDLAFVHWFGVAGIALATSAMYLVSASALMWVIRAKLLREIRAAESAQTFPTSSSPGIASPEADVSHVSRAA